MSTPVDHFRRLHRPGHPLVLPNAWDAGSARIVADLGAEAIATTSAGVAWAHGLPDGGALSRPAQLALAQQLVAAVDLPVTMDVEDGYGAAPEGVAEFVAALSGAGVVGVNIEDSTSGAQRAAEDFAAFLTGLRGALAAAGVEVFVNVRIDSYLLGSGETHVRVLERGRAYVQAGADGIFLPGLADLRAIEAACRTLEAPVNVMVPAADLTVSDLASAGVARLSTGMWLSQLAYGAARAAVAGVLQGSLATPALVPADYGVLNQHMAVPPTV